VAFLRRRFSTRLPYTTLFRSFEVLRQQSVQFMRLRAGARLQVLRHLPMQQDAPRGAYVLVHHLADLVVAEVVVPALRFLPQQPRSEEHTSELQSRENRVCRLL